MHWGGLEVYPSQGDGELEMMRTIEASGWRGQIGLPAEMGGDAEVTLKDYIAGLDWPAAEISQPDSGDLVPSPRVRQHDARWRPVRQVGDPAAAAPDPIAW